MNKLVECQVAIVPWGTKARFRIAKIGLSRKNETSVYIMIVSNQPLKKLLVSSNTQVLPAAIRFNDLQSDLYVRQIDPKVWETFKKIIQIVSRDKTQTSIKTNCINRLLSVIPSAYNSSELKVNRASPKLKIEGLDGKVLPAEIWTRTNLTELSLIDCNLTKLPKQIEKLASSLTYLNLSKNLIEQIPVTFFHTMTKLKNLDLSENKINFLPIEIKFLKGLVTLNLGNNNLKTLPPTFTDLHKLRMLCIHNNQLSRLPEFRKEEIRLDILDVSYNPLDGCSFECYLAPAAGSQPDPLKLFNIALLSVVKSDRLLRLSSISQLPRDITDSIQTDLYKCFKCRKLNILPAHRSMNFLEYLNDVEKLISNGNYKRGMMFHRSICQICFINMT